MQNVLRILTNQLTVRGILSIMSPFAVIAKKITDYFTIQKVYVDSKVAVTERLDLLNHLKALEVKAKVLPFLTTLRSLTLKKIKKAS